MLRFNRTIALLSVILVAACGEDASPPVTPAAAAQAAGAAAGGAAADVETSHWPRDDDQIGPVFAAALGDSDALPGDVPPSVSKMHTGVVALHDLLLERRTPAPSRAALLDALAVFAERPGGCDAAALAAALPKWRQWTDEEATTEAHWARSLTLATAALALHESPGARGLTDLVTKAEEGGSPPPASPAAAGIAFVRYAALALGEPGSDVSDRQHAALAAAREAFAALDWPGGLAELAEPLSLLLIDQDPVGVRGSLLWTTAVESYRASGNGVRSGLMYVERARRTWWGQPDPAAVERARLYSETGLLRLEQAGADGDVVALARAALAALQQAGGRHDEAVATAERITSMTDALPEGLRSRMEQLRAVSYLRLGRYDEAVTAADAAAALHAKIVLPPGDPRDDERQRIAAEIDEIAAAALLASARPADAAARYRRAAERHAERAKNAVSAARGAVEQDRDAARLLRGRALARAGNEPAARAAVREVLEARAQPASLLALAADVLVDAGFVDDAADVLAQTRAKVGEARSGALGAIAARIAVARGDIESARLGFQTALDHVTGGDGERHGPPAARILRHWAEAERELGDAVDAITLVRQALGHLEGSGMVAEITELEDLLRALSQ